MPDTDSGRDLLGQRAGFWSLWGIPIAILLALNIIHLPTPWAVSILAACLGWMGVGCAINARRCRRRHCFLASPVLLAGAVMTVLTGFRILDLGAFGVSYVIWGTLAAVLLTFLPERSWGKYLSR